MHAPVFSPSRRLFSFPVWIFSLVISLVFNAAGERLKKGLWEGGREPRTPPHLSNSGSVLTFSEPILQMITNQNQVWLR